MKLLHPVSKDFEGRYWDWVAVPYKFSMHQMIVNKSRKATSVKDHPLQCSPMHSSYFLVTPDSLSPSEIHPKQSKFKTYLSVAKQSHRDYSAVIIWTLRCGHSLIQQL